MEKCGKISEKFGERQKQFKERSCCPGDNWLLVCTDVSYLKTNGKAGTRVFYKLFSHYISVGAEKSTFEEVKATEVTLTSVLY